MYTLGQREGLGIFGGNKKVYYVNKKDLTNNTLYVSDQPPTTRNLIAQEINLLEDLKVGDKIEARIRHGQPPQSISIVKVEQDQVKLRFEQPQAAVAPGQSVVFSKGAKILGGGIIADSGL